MDNNDTDTNNNHNDDDYDNNHSNNENDTKIKLFKNKLGIPPVAIRDWQTSVYIKNYKEASLRSNPAPEAVLPALRYGTHI